MRSKIHFHKVAAILGVKFRAIANGNMAVMPIFIIVLAVVLRFAFKSMGGGEVNSFVSGYILNFGLTFNIGSMGIFLTSAILAEEKEKNTLRVLMTSSVNGAEFFIGSILPIFTVMMAVNVLVLLVSGDSHGNGQSLDVFGNHRGGKPDGMHLWNASWNFYEKSGGGKHAVHTLPVAGDPDPGIFLPDSGAEEGLRFFVHRRSGRDGRKLCGRAGLSVKPVKRNRAGGDRRAGKRSIPSCL